MSENEAPDNGLIAQENSNAPLYYVGIGASAGGLEALETFFSNMPSNSELAFIVIQHLSPDHKSLMVQLLSKFTEMHIYRAEDGTLVEKNSVYLIPPKKNLTIFHGKLQLNDPDYSKGINLPIDIFLRSLAQDQKEKSIGVILSGTGSDGTRGIRNIKDDGGMVMVQDEKSAKFDGMPRSVIATGLADFILTPEEMPDQIISFVKHPAVTKQEYDSSLLKDKNGIARVFALLHMRHEIDFTYYKGTTIGRRIERRMTVNHVNDLRDYIKLLENMPNEIDNLYRELLIGVTSFFRDPEAFQALSKKYLPDLLENWQGNEMRVWIPGCSTGEEPYSIAILLKETMESMGKQIPLKIFATDVDNNAIMHAGNGVYPESVAADLDSQLIAKYFVRKDDHTLTVVPSLREIVVFAKHNIVKDPPFTNISLISCRNLLIYLQPVLQKKILEFFNFSLHPEGLLFLGTSETIGEMSEYFETLDQHWKVYRSRGKKRLTGMSERFVSESQIQSELPTAQQPMGQQNRQSGFNIEETYMEAILNLLGQTYFNCAVVVRDTLDIVQIYGDSEGFLKFPTGKVTNDITKVINEQLSIPLSSGLQRIIKKKKDKVYSILKMNTSEGEKNIKLQILPIPHRKGLEHRYLILLDKMDQVASSEDQIQVTYDIDKETEERIHDLEQELQFNKENLQATIEELETSNEELQATNEELLASNEELQSTNEELQSVNEELYTVNSEYQQKIVELTELNNDMNNFLSSTAIPTLFLDENLTIRKYTPEIGAIIQILESDIGRSLSDLSHNIMDFDLTTAIDEVQRKNRQQELEIQTRDGQWYLLRLTPYYIANKISAGVVLNFININQQKQAQQKIAFQARILDSVNQPIIATDLYSNIIFWNQAATEFFGWQSEEVQGKGLHEIMEAEKTQEQKTKEQQNLTAGQSWQGSYTIQTKDQQSIKIKVTDSPIYNKSKELVGIVSIITKA